MVNIETPVVSESPAILREIIHNQVSISHESILTKSKMQETTTDLTSERENSSPKHVTRSDQESEIGSDAESSFLDQSRVDETEVDEAKSDMDDNQSNGVTSGEEGRDLMRSRAEMLVSGHPHHYADMEAMYGINEVRRQKRKQSLPQQYEQASKLRHLDGHPFEDDLWALRQQMSAVQNYFRYFDEGIPKPMNGYAGMENIHRLHQAYFANLQAARHAEELQKEQQQNAQAKAILGAFEKRVSNEHDHYNIAEHVRETVNANKGLSKGASELNERELNELVSCLKSKIEEAVSATVDYELSKFFDKRSKQKETGNGNISNKNAMRNGDTKHEMEREKKTTDHSLNHILQLPDSKVNINNNGLFRLPECHSAFELPKLSGNGIQEMPRPPFPHHPPLGYPPRSFYLPTSLHPPSLYSCPIVPPEQTEALSLVINTPKKKRTKVTDTRLSPRAARALLHENGSLGAVYDHERALCASYGQMNPPCLPTSVAIPNPSLQQSELLNFYKEQRMCSSPGDLDRTTPCSSNSPSSGYSFMNYNDSDSFDSHGKQTTDTLTPMHLRKAKLMFFYVRYPSSAILKMFFPDVQFNKNNTAQLVKWFSNFREFYYIQMEKYARQAIAEGCKRSEDLVVATDSELNRVLNLHYNRNNQIEVPENFRLASQATLREFYLALVANKDQEPSWKKPIYKVIARMDDALPEFFKASNWMDQLGDP